MDAAACAVGLSLQRRTYRAVGDTVAAGQQPIVTDAVEAFRQHVHQEPADELVRRQRHGFPAARTFDAIVLPAERHATIISRDEPAVRDGDAMGVAREIAQDLLWPGEWLFAVDDPLGSAQRCQELLEGSFVGEP